MKTTFLFSLLLAFLLQGSSAQARLGEDVQSYDSVEQVPSPDGTLILRSSFNRFPKISALATRKRENLAGLIFDAKSGTELSDLWKYSDEFRIYNPEGGLNCKGKGWPADRLLQISWSPDSLHVAFAVESESGVHLWISGSEDCQARRLSNTSVRLIADSNAYFRWAGSQTLLALTQKRPAAAVIDPQLPHRYNAGGKATMRRFYRGLLQNEDDQKNFTQALSSHLISIDLSGQVKRLDAKDRLYALISVSPDGRFAAVSFWKYPAPLHTPIRQMSQDFGIVDLEAAKRNPSEHALEQLPLSQTARSQGHFGWRGGNPHSFFWWEAAKSSEGILGTILRTWDGDDRKIVTLDQLKGSLEGLAWRSNGEHVCVVRDPGEGLQLVLKDQTRIKLDAGNFLGFAHKPGVYGEDVLADEKDQLLVNQVLDSDDGPREYLNQVDLKTGQLKRVWTAMAGRSEAFLGLQAGLANQLLIRSESSKNPPAVFLRNLSQDTQILISPGETVKDDSIPQRITLHYTRSDGIPLSADLFLPPQVQKGILPPLVVAAYPMYRSKSDDLRFRNTSVFRFERIYPDNPLSLVLDGFAVLENVAMPIIASDKEGPTGSETILNQMLENLHLALEAAIKSGKIQSKAAIFGHSFAANMGAIVLANSQKFQCGIAINGAYNRTLMPFGFQDVKRTYWDDQGLYLGLSPQLQAERIAAPLLLMHGEADDNPATLPIQSDLMFHTLNSLGKSTRLVVFPHEDHFFRSRETIRDAHQEQVTWLRECFK